MSTNVNTSSFQSYQSSGSEIGKPKTSAEKIAAKVNDSGIFATILRFLSYIFGCFCCRSDDATPDPQPIKVTAPTGEAPRTKEVASKALPGTQASSNPKTKGTAGGEKDRLGTSGKARKNRHSAKADAVRTKTSVATAEAARTLASQPKTAPTKPSLGPQAAPTAGPTSSAPTDPFAVFKGLNPTVASSVSGPARALGNVVNAFAHTQEATTVITKSVLDLDAVRDWVRRKGLDYDTVKDPVTEPFHREYTGYIGNDYYDKQSVWHVPYLAPSEFGNNTQKRAFLIPTKELAEIRKSFGKTEFLSGAPLHEQRLKMGLTKQ